MSDNKNMTQIDFIIDGGYTHYLEDEKKKKGLTYFLLDNIGQLPQDLLIMFAKRGWKNELEAMTLEQVEKEFHALHKLLKQQEAEASQNENKVANEKKA